MSARGKATSIPDPNVQIPAAIRAQAERADKLFQTQIEGVDPNASEGGGEGGGGRGVEGGAGGTEGGGEPPANGAGAPANGAEPPAPESSPPQPPTPPTPPRGESEDDQSWEHRYKSMKGRYDRAEQNNQELLRRIEGLQNVISTMSAAPSASAAPPEQRATSLITPEEESEYGSEFLAVVGKRAKQELTPEVQELKATIANLEKRLNGVGTSVAMNARQRMETTLDERCPQWREINHDQNFLRWLGLPDVYSGAKRHDLLKAAFERNDTPRVQAFFDGFLAEEAAVAPRAQEPGLQVEPNKPTKVPLRELAAPGRAKSPAAPAPDEKPVISRSQIAAFYSQVAAGKFRGNEQEKNRLEAMIFDAEREGRIV